MPRLGNAHTYGPWVGGWNASKPSDDLDAREIYDGQNMRIFPDGSARQRSGTTIFNASALTGTATIDSFGQHKFSASSEKIWAITNATFYEDTVGDGTGFTDRTGGMTITAGNRWSMANANGTLIGHNGVTNDTILKWTAAAGNVAALNVDSRFTTAKHWEFWDNRAWAGNLSSGTDRVWRSDLADITTWGATSFFQTGDIMTGMRKMSNYMVIHSEEIIHLLVPTGNAVTPYRKVPKQHPGTIAPFSVVTVTIPDVGEVQLYIREDGIYAFDGETARKLSERLDGDRFWDDLNRTALVDAFAMVYARRSEVWFFLPHGTGQTTMNNIVVYNYRLGIFYPRWLGVTRTDAAVMDNKPYCGGLSDGFIYDHEDTALNDYYSATKNAIDAWFQTSSRPPDGEVEQCRWLYNRTTTDILGDYDVEFSATMPSSPEVTDVISQGGTLDAIETAFQIGTSAISGEDTLVGNVDSGLEGYDPHIQIKFRNGTVDEQFSIRKTTPVYRPIGQTRKRGAGVI